MKLAFIVGRTLLSAHVSSFPSRVYTQRFSVHFSMGFVLVSDVV
jgi:hypothetical protein